MLRRLVAFLLALAGALAIGTTSTATATTTASAATFAYDAQPVARVDTREITTGPAASPQVSGVQAASVSPSGDVRRTSTTFLTRNLATNTADDIAGLADDYIDITAKGSRVRNVQTSVSRSSFEQNLIEAGYQPPVVSPGKNVVSYELNGTRYVVRDAATSTGGPTADFYPVGSSSFTLKIRLGG